MAYMKHIVLYHWSLCACIVIGCVIRVYIGSCVATSESGYLILYFAQCRTSCPYISVQDTRMVTYNIVSTLLLATCTCRHELIR